MATLLKKLKSIWVKIDNLDKDILLYAFFISLIVFLAFLPFSIKEAFNMLFFGILCLFFYKIFDDKKHDKFLLDENVF